MPRIPKAQGAGLVSTNVQKMPTQSIQSAMQPHQANMRLAKSVGDTLTQVTNVLQNEEKKAYGKKAQADYLLAADELYANMTTDNKYENDLASFEKDYDKELKNLRKGLVKDAPYDFVKQSTDGMLANSELNYRRQGASFARNQRVKNTINMQNENTNKLATHFTNNFNYENANEFINAKAESISGYQNANLYTPEQSKELSDKAIDKYFNSMVDYYEARPDRIGELKDILTFNHPKSGQLIDGVKSEKIGDQLKRIERIEGQNTSISKSKVNSRLRDMQTAIMQGNFLPEESFADAANNIDPSWDNATELTDNIVHMGLMNKQLSEFADGTAEEKAAIMKKGFEVSPSADPAFNATARNQMVSTYKNALAKISKDVQTNGAEYAMRDRKDLQIASMTLMDLGPEVSPDAYKANVQEWIAASLPLQQGKGVANARVTTTDQAKHMTQLIETAQGDQAGQMIDKLAHGFGDHSGKLMQELVEHGGLDVKYTPAFLMGSGRSKQQFFDNLKNQKEGINPAIASLEDKIDYSFVRGNEKLIEFQNSMNIADRTGKYAAQMTKAVELEYGRLVANEGLAPDDAQKKAVDLYINQNFDIATENNALIIPKDLGVDKEKVEDFVSNASSKNFNGYDQLQIDIPPHHKKLLEEDGTRADKMDQIYKEHIADNGVWIWNGSDGAVLYENLGGSYSPVMNKLGQQVQMGYRDMETFSPAPFQSKDVADVPLVKSGRGI